MCKESPFPRCESHAKEKMKNKHAKMQAASIEYNAVKAEELNKQHFLERDHDSVDSNPKVKKALKRYQKAQQEYDLAVAENSITLSSLNNLKSQIIDIQTHLRNPALNPTVESYDYSETGLKKLEKLYQDRMNERKARMSAYDEIHHTVNGRKPSKYGTTAGVLKLKAQQAKAFDSWMTGLEQELPDEEVRRRAGEVEKIQKSYGHAVATILQKRQNSVRNSSSSKNSLQNIKPRSSKENK